MDTQGVEWQHLVVNTYFMSQGFGWVLGNLINPIVCYLGNIIIRFEHKYKSGFKRMLFRMYKLEFNVNFVVMIALKVHWVLIEM